ncbi:MAG: twin-arginine translocase TatA/TatE family subunit [Planctomycetaceae bacterium]|jgi:sec-independent protein translocase protein TatA|nr:twin-arginine translocase TatA/TatE family subunit [Planctomycetaceae bacterium]
MINSMILGFFGASSAFAYIALAIVAFLLFGNRLPSVMRSLGRSVVEFKKGVAGIEDELDEAVRTADEKATSKSDGKTEV